MDVNEALSVLESSPETFLKECTLRIAGSLSSNGVETYYLMRKSDPSVFLISNQEIYEVKVEITVFVLPMTQIPDDGVENVADLLTPLPDANDDGAPTLIITGSLSGCVLGLSKDGKSIFHLKPNKKISGKILQSTLESMDYHLYGKKDYETKKSSDVIGVKKDGKYRFYAQEKEDGKPNRVITLFDGSKTCTIL